MATTVATFASTLHTGAYPNQVRLDRRRSGELLMIVGDRVNGWLRGYRSTNNGGSWSEDTNLRITTALPQHGASMRILSRPDGSERLGIVYRRGSDDRMMVAFAYPSQGVWRFHPHSPKETSRKKGDADFVRPDLEMYHGGDHGFLIPTMWGALDSGVAAVWMGRTRFLPDDAYSDDEVMIHTRSGMSIAPAPSVALRHLGDDTRPNDAMPDLYGAWFTGTNVDPTDRAHSMRLTKSGTTWSAGERRNYEDSAHAGRIASCFTGQRLAIVRALAGASSEIAMVLVHPDDATRSELTVPAMGLGEITSLAVTWDAFTADVFIIAAGTTNKRPRYLRYLWATREWANAGAWTEINTDAVIDDSLTAAPGSKGSRVEISYVIDVSGTSRAWRYELATLTNVKPNAATWDVASGPRDRNASLPLDWSHNDPDGDAQVQYELTRQINGGTVNYWNGASWQTGVAQPTNATTIVTLSSAWGLDGELHTYRVRTKDAAAWGPQSAVLSILASVKVNPTITAPAGGTLTTPTPTITWTATEQSSYRVRALIAGVEAWSTGWVGDAAARSYVVPEEQALANATSYTLEVTTTNLEGLESTAATVAVNVVLTPPATPTRVATADPAEGAISVTITNPAPGAGEATTTRSNLWREDTIDPTAAWVLVAADVAPNGTVLDRDVESDRVYRYHVEAFTGQGAAAWSTQTTTASVALDDVFLHDAANLDSYLRLTTAVTGSGSGPQSAELDAAGGARASSGRGRIARLDLSFQLCTRAQRRQLEAWAETYLLYRDPRGRTMRGVFEDKDVQVGEINGVDRADCTVRFVGTTTGPVV